MNDFLAFGELLKKRMHETIAGVQAVKTASELAGIEEKALASPSIFVVYQGDRPPKDSDQFATHYTTQRWLIVLAVRNKRDAAGGSGAQAEAGPMLAQIIHSMSAWQPGEGFRRPARVSAPAPGWTPGGFGYFPVAYECDVLNLDD